jgi:hypothetical protein
MSTKDRTRREKGPWSQFRPKVYDRKVSGTLTREGWELFDQQLESTGLSQGDVIELLLRKNAGQAV